MTLRILVDGAHPEETRVVIADDERIQEFDIETSTKKQFKGNVYLAKVTRVEPSLQAAFVEYGSERQGFLPFSEIHPDYFTLPTADKQELLEEHGRAMAQESADEEEKEEKKEKALKKTSRKKTKTDKAKAGKEEAEEEQPEEDKEEDKKEDDRQEDEVEEFESEDLFQEKATRQNIYKKYKIQEVIKKGQVILVQLMKEERGNKGAAMTTYISLPGRYCVLMPNTQGSGGVSRRIRGFKERKSLKTVVGSLKVPDSMSVIVRTAGLGHTKAEIKRDYEYLVKVWNDLRATALASVAPSLVYEEGDIIKSSVRDLYNPSIEEIVVEGKEAYKKAKDLMKLMVPSHAKRVKEHSDDVPLFYAYNVEQELLTLHHPISVMPSGGYIVINPTEALISIDVNSGKSTGERDVEAMALATNIEAAQEIARQLRLRDLAGLIVIDFIDMNHYRNRRAVERALKEALRGDKSKIQVGRISHFGLLEMSRQRMRSSLVEVTYSECQSCQGSGLVQSTESVSVQLMRQVENEVSRSKIKRVKVKTTPEIAIYFLNNKRERIIQIEKQYRFKLDIEPSDKIPPSQYEMEIIGEGKNPVVISSLSLIEEINQQKKKTSKRRSDRKRKNDKKTQKKSADKTEENGEIIEQSDEKEGGVVEKKGKSAQKKSRSKPFNKNKAKKDESQDLTENDDNAEAKKDKKPAKKPRKKPAGKKSTKPDKEPAMAEANDNNSAPSEDLPEGDKKKGWWQNIIE